MARTLIFEPEERIAEAVRKVIEAEGHEASSVFDREAALARLEAEPFDLVFCDAGAVEAVLDAAANAGNKPLVVATALLLEKSTVLAALRAGAFRMLSKPIGMKELRRVLGEAVEELSERESA